MGNLILILAVMLSSTFSYAKATKKKEVINQETILREKQIGISIKRDLETYHFRDIDVDDSVSQKAFQELLKKFDYGKQFFLESDIKKFERFQFKLDDQMVSADHQLLNEMISVFNSRVKEIDEFRKELFKKDLSFDSNDELELDPKKRNWATSMGQLKDLWRKTYTQTVMSRYISLKEAQEEPKKDEKSKSKTNKKKTVKKKEEKKLSEKELVAKAHKAINEKYEKYFSRILEDDRIDYIEKYMNSIATIFDPHTVYMPPKRKEDFDIDISGSLEGIGAVLQEDGSFIKVVRIVPGGAAWRQRDLEVDDVILMVGQGEGEPVDLVDMRVDEAVRYIRGKKGTEVRLTVKKVDGTRKVIPIIRDVVQVDASYAKGSVLENKKLGIKVGYIHVPKFYRDFETGERNCTDDVRMELERLKKQNVDGMILDLRNNGGGALQDAQNMSGLFIKEGPIVQIKSHMGQIDVLKDKDPEVTYGGPLIVMINVFSASASEILAAALQDYGRAVIVGGEYTHGKGTVQAVVDLNRGILRQFYNDSIGALKLTIQKFYRITGASTQYKGVTPDIALPDPFSYTKSREQDIEYSLPWDKVPAEKFAKWQGTPFDLKSLKNRSEKRVNKDERFKKIKESVSYLTKRAEDTVVSLNLKKVLAKDKENEAMAEKLKMEDENKDILVSEFEASLRSHEKVGSGKENQKKWKEEFEIRKEEWVKNLRQDPMIEETLFIMDDMIKTFKGKKLTALK